MPSLHEFANTENPDINIWSDEMAFLAQKQEGQYKNFKTVDKA